MFQRKAKMFVSLLTILAVLGSMLSFAIVATEDTPAEVILEDFEDATHVANWYQGVAGATMTQDTDVRYNGTASGRFENSRASGYTGDGTNANVVNFDLRNYEKIRFYAKNPGETDVVLIFYIYLTNYKSVGGHFRGYVEVKANTDFTAYEFALEDMVLENNATVTMGSQAKESWKILEYGFIPVNVGLHTLYIDDITVVGAAASEPDEPKTQTTILEIAGPEINEQYGLTRIYLNTDAIYNSKLEASYKHIESLEHVSSPVDADVAASWLAALKINGKILAEYNKAQWYAVSVYLNNVNGKQQYEIRVTNTACPSLVPSNNITLELESSLLDINGKPFVPVSLYWNASEARWFTLSDKQLDIISKIDTLLPLADLTLKDVGHYDAVYAEYNALTEEEKKAIPNADVLRNAESIMSYLKGVPEVDFDEDNVVLNFVAFSDVHITTTPEALDTEETGCTEERYEHAMQQISEMDVDALLFLGDMSNDTAYTDEPSIRDYEINTFKRITESYIDDSVQLFYCLGNHDSQNSHDENYIPDGVIARYYQEILGDRWLIEGEDNDGKGNRHAVINGHHFIAVEPKWKGGGSYTDETIAWFEETLESIVNDPDYNNEYIFVLSHPIATGDDIYGTGGGISTFPRLHEVMKNYPQIVKFSGHTHFPMNNETIINQSDYTSVGIGAFFYITMYYWNDLLLDGGTYNQKGYYPSDSRATAPGLQVEIDANGNMRMTRIDFYRDGETTQDSWLIPAVDAEEKTHLNYYSVARANVNEAPYFDEGGSLVAERETFSKLVLTWDTAKDDDEVYYYRIEFVQNGEIVDSRRVYSHFWRYNQPGDWPAYQQVEMDYPSFTAPYEIRLYAVDVWEKESTNYLTLKVEPPSQSQLKNAQSVEQLISHIGTVTVSSKSAIETAEAAYLALSHDERYLVSNIDLLRTARLTFNELEPSQATLPAIFEYVTVNGVQHVMPTAAGNQLFCLFGFDVEPGQIMNMDAYYMAGPGGEPMPSYLRTNCLDHLLLNGKSLRQWQSDGVYFQVHIIRVAGPSLLHIFWDPNNATDFTMDKTFTISVDEGFITPNNQIIRPFTATWDTTYLQYVIDKENGADQSKPEVIQVTQNSVELKKVEGCEYRMNKGDWRKDPLFTNLEPGKSYNFYIRTAETDSNHVGAISEVLTVTTLTPEKTVSAVEWVKRPTKVSYVVGEALDLTGGEIRVIYTDGTEEILTVTADMMSGYDNTKTGTQTITICYGNKSIDFVITIMANMENGSSDDSLNPEDGAEDSDSNNGSEDSDAESPNTGDRFMVWPFVGIMAMFALVSAGVLKRRGMC